MLIGFLMSSIHLPFATASATVLLALTDGLNFAQPVVQYPRWFFRATIFQSNK
jgi:hypothetical protein